MNKLLLFHSFNNTKNADPFYDLSISAYKQILRNIEDLLLSDQVMISFDDGYKSILPAVDFAHKLGFKTNVNIVTSKINKPGFLSDKDIKMLFNKRTLIGSHSHTHKDFSRLQDQLLEKELTTSKKLLEDIIEVPVNYFRHPTHSHPDLTETRFSAIPPPRLRHPPYATHLAAQPDLPSSSMLRTGRRPGATSG